MSGIRREYDYPVLNIREEITVSNKDKGEVFKKEFSKVNSSENLMKESKDMREKMLIDHPYIREIKRATNSPLDARFSIPELKRALKNTKTSTPGQDVVLKKMLC